MIPVLSAQQIKQADEYTIQYEPIASIDLMERAAVSFCDWFLNNFRKLELKVSIFCGKGNNGGDGLAIARLLFYAGVKVRVFILNYIETASEDFVINKNRLPHGIIISEINDLKQVDLNIDNEVIIDAILGVGLNKNISGFIADTISILNNINGIKLAVDIPTGLMADTFSTGIIFKAHYTFTFQQQKLAFLFPENYQYCGDVVVGNIQLQTTCFAPQELTYHILEQKDIEQFIKSLHLFLHKGNFGHALIVAGSYGKIGAAILSSKAALHTGCGLLTAYLPKCGVNIMQTAFPEAMVNADKEELFISSIENNNKYNAVAMGPGLGTHKKTAKALVNFLKNYAGNLVLDADALNIIAEYKALKYLPNHSILTPHPKEFERLFGKTNNGFEQLDLLKQKAKEHKVYIVLKGRYSAIATPQGKIFFNETGNNAMATAGSGDVLTGIITSLLAQGYNAEQAVIMGVFIHGKAGDAAYKKYNRAYVTAEKIIEGIADVQFEKAW